MRILTLLRHYLPGFKSGGPIRSVANLVEHLGKDLNFIIVTSDRDSGDRAPYTGISPGERRRVGKAEVLYISAPQLRPHCIARLVREVRPDVLYLNSFFSWPFSIDVVLLRRLGIIPPVPIVLAPRGEFSAGALQIKAPKKRTFVAFSRALRLHRDLIWQASTPFEVADIQRSMGLVERDGRSRIIVAPILASPHRLDGQSGPVAPVRSRQKVPHQLRAAFLSRVVPKKNLLGALQILQGVRGQVEFNIFGPVEDEEYWRKCCQAMESLPANVRAAYKGPVAPADVLDILAQHDLFFLPTRGENYGHVIREALAAGTPVLLSDQTPWRGLAGARVGWDLPLDRPEDFQRVLEMCVAMDSATFADWSHRAAWYAWRHAADERAVEANRQLFTTAVQSAGSIPGEELTEQR